MANQVVGNNLKTPKALTLKQLVALNQDEQPTLQEYVPALDAAAPVVNRPSSVNSAAFATMLSPEGTSGQAMIDSYRQVLSENSLEGESYHASQLHQQATQVAMQGNGDALMDILANPSLTDDQKKLAVSKVYDAKSVMYSPDNLVAAKALSNPTEGLPNHEEDTVRYNMAGVLNDITQAKADTQKIYNYNKSLVQPDLNQHIYDFGVGMIPGVKNIILGHIAADQSDTPIRAFVKTFLSLSGNNLDYMRDKIAQLPPDQQAGAAEAFANLANTHSNILFNKPDDYDRRHILQSVIGGEGYSSKEELADNLGTLMDLALVGGPLIKGAKTVGRFSKAAKVGAKDSEVAAAFKADYEENYSAMKAAEKPTPANDAPDLVEPPKNYTPQNKNSLGQFKRSRERQIYDSSTGVPYRKMPPLNPLSSAIRDGIRSEVQPASLFQNLKDTNPSMARNAYEAMSQDASGEAAEAMTGATRTDAIGQAMMPEVAHIDGSVANKVAVPDAIEQTRNALPAEVVDFVKHDGLTQYSQAEKAMARAWKVNQFQEASSMVDRPEMFQILPDLSKFVDTPQGLSVRAVYGPQNSGFSSAEHALEMAKFALRNTGISDDTLGLLRRAGSDYIPTNLEEISALKTASSKFEVATTNSGELKASANTSKGYSMDLVDKPTSLDTSGYGLKDGQWIREITAHDKTTGDEIGRLIYTNYDRPPSIRVNKDAQRKGVATSMLKLAKARGGQLGDDVTGEFASGAKSTRSDEGQAFRSGNNPEDVQLFNSEAQGNGLIDDYLVTVDHNYKIDAADVTKAEGWQPLKVKLNFFDRHLWTDGSQGTFQNMILDPQSMLDPIVVGPSVLGIDKATAIEKALLRDVNDFAKSMKASSKQAQAKIANEIYEANLTSRDYDYNRLTASGLSAENIDTLNKFKKFWDSIWHLKNQYFAKQLDKAGYEEFVHTASNTSLPARRVGKQNFSNGANVYDSATDTIIRMTKDDVDNLYAANGGIAKLRQPVVMQGGGIGEYVKHTNNPNDGYLRSFHANSQVLNYRPGYYGIDYKDPFHIIEKVTDANDNFLYERSVATAKDTKAAKLLSDNMGRQIGPMQDGSPRFFFRKDTKLNSEGRFERELDINQAQGMSSFRRRGKLLDDSNSPVTNLTNSHVRSPVETMVNQAVAVSKKIAMQDIIDAQKQRAISQWGHFLPKGDFGQPLVPKDLRKIKYRGGINQNQSDVADARTSFGYINYLENSYVNLLDDGIKSLFHNVADLMGKLEAPGKLEQLTREMGEHSLTNGLKSASYYAYLGLSPLRQLVIQGHQAVMLSALNPSWMVSKAAFAQPNYLALRVLGMESTHPILAKLGSAAWGSVQESEKVFAQFQRTGIPTAIDHQNMISGAVNDLAANMIANSRTTAIGNVMKVPHAVASVARKIGFDSGEFYNSTMSWLAHRDSAAKAGLNVAADDVIDQVSSAARNYTGNMNTAGDLASNKNMLSLIFQYTQNSQKLLLNLATNRAIPSSLKLKMALVSVALFGTGNAIFYGSKLASIQDENMKEIVRNGIEGWGLNKIFSLATGQKSDTDWSGMSPYNAYGTLDMIHGLLTTNIGEIIANSPSLSMFFGNNPRVANAVKDMTRYTHLVDDYQKPTDLLTVAESFAKISSGYSAFMKAKYIAEVRKKVSAAGTITDENIDRVNALGALLGFPTNKEIAHQYVVSSVIDKRKEIQKDVNEYYKQLKRHYVDEHVNGNELLYTQRFLNEFHRAYRDEPYAQEIFNKLLRNDLDHGDASLYNTIMRNCPLYSQGDCMQLIDAAPFENEKDKEDLKTLLNFGNQYHQSDYDEKDK